jgi:hypothetical protein
MTLRFIWWAVETAIGARWRTRLAGANMSRFERLLELGCTEPAACRCGNDMNVARIERLPEGSDADVRVYRAVPLVSTRCGLPYGLQWRGKSKTTAGADFDDVRALVAGA